MATRSCIGIKHGDVIKGIYAHWDGYLECNGLILAKHYSDSVKVNKLISMGDVSSLGADIGEQHDFNDTPPDKDWCTFYGRDRGEEDIEFRTFQSTEEFIKYFDDMGAEYYYLYDNGKWYYTSYNKNKFKELEVEIIMKTLTENA